MASNNQNTNNTQNTNSNQNTNNNQQPNNTNNGIQTWFNDLFNSIKSGDRNNISGALKDMPPSIKKVTNVLGLATIAVTASINAVKKLVKSFNESADKFREITNLSVHNNTADKLDLKRAKNIEHVNSINASIETLKNSIDSFILNLAGAFAEYEKWWANEWNRKVGRFIPDLKLDISKFDNPEAQSTAEQRDLSLQTAINEARAGGADEKTAHILGNKFNSLILDFMGSAKDGVTYESMADAIHKAVFSGDTKGLEDLGFGIDEYIIKAGMYNQGFDVSGGTKYMDSALAGGRLSVLEKILSLTDAQLQEMTDQGFVLDNINQNFAWESVEAISAVNTDGGHYDSKGNFILEDISESLDKTADNMDKSTKEMLNFYSSNHSGSALGFNRIGETSGIIMSDRQLMSGFNYNIPDLDTSKNGHNYASRVDVNVKVESDDEKLRAYVKDIAQAETYAGVNNSFTGGNSTTRRSNNRASFNPIL